MWIPVVIAVLIVLVALYVTLRGRYYARLFSAESFREFHSALSKAVDVAQHKPPDQRPSTADGTGFVTGPGLAVCVTCSKGDDGIQTLHISLSQARPVTRAVCSRFGFFALVMLGDAKGELTPYFTASGVHHLVFRLQAATIPLQDFESSLARYLTDYKPIPFRYEKLQRTRGSSEPAPGVSV